MTDGQLAPGSAAERDASGGSGALGGSGASGAAAEPGASSGSGAPGGFGAPAAAAEPGAPGGSDAPGAPGIAGPGDDLDPADPARCDPREAMSLQIAWLRTFLAVADRGGFSAATLVLHLSQSRVSAHIAALEHTLGVTLFDRKARPICLTAAGELFRCHATDSLVELQRGVEAARSVLGNFVAHITVGSYPSVSSTYLPPILRTLKSDYPGVTVELSEGTASTLEEMVVSGTVDVAFRPLLPRMRGGTALSHRTIWREDIVAVMREDDPLARHPSVGVEDVAARPLIGNPAGTEEDGGGFDLRNSLGYAADFADIAYLTDQPATLVALVRSAFGIGVINRLALQTTSTEGLAVRTIGSPTAHREVALFWAKRRTDSPGVKAFLSAQQRAPLPPGVHPVAP